MVKRVGPTCPLLCFGLGAAVPLPNKAALSSGAERSGEGRLGRAPSGPTPRPRALVCLSAKWAQWQPLSAHSRAMGTR